MNIYTSDVLFRTPGIPSKQYLICHRFMDIRQTHNAPLTDTSMPNTQEHKFYVKQAAIIA